MSKPSKATLDFMAQHAIDADEVWEVRNGTWAVKHSALERVAAQKSITFDAPLMLEFHAADKIAVLCITGRMGERSEWSIGEAAPYNNKNTYPFAMAEKRAKDRVILKLLNAHGTLYSDAEADEFQRPAGKRDNPHRTTPEDVSDAKPRYDERGNRIDCIPVDGHRVEKVLVKVQREQANAIMPTLYECKTAQQLIDWGEKHAETISGWSPEWIETAQKRYQDHLDDLRNQQQKAA